MIVLRSPKGWTGPKEVDGLKTEGFWRSHQVPLSGIAENPEHLKLLEEWLKSYRPEELFDETGAPIAAIRATAPQGRAAHERQSSCQWRTAAQVARASGLHDHAIAVGQPGSMKAESTKAMGDFLRAVMELNETAQELPHRRPRRDRLQPAAGRVQGD